MTRDELLTGVEWDVMGKDQIEAAQIANANNLGRKVVPPVVPPDDEPRHVGELPVARDYGIAHKIARNIWQRATATEGDVA